MTPPRRPIVVDEERTLWFRARRGHLAGPGARDVAAAASTILGAQSQQLGPSLWALALRTKGRPTRTAVRRALFDERALVRTWGQRDTLHLYDTADWNDVVAAGRDWVVSSRLNVMPSPTLYAKARARIRSSVEPWTRRDLFDLPPRSLLKEAAERLGEGGLPAKRLAVARLFWRLAQEGEVCLGDKVGAEQTYVARAAWSPELAWPEPDPAGAHLGFVRRYLALHGPATANDVAHFFGARVALAKDWIAALADELRPVECGERDGLLVLARDARALAAPPPKEIGGKGAGGWPVRLLPLWDTLLMAHADKDWTLPTPAERKRVWKAGAYVQAVVLARGRIVATWSAKERARDVRVTVQPLSGWRTSHAAAVRREARALAAHLERERVEVVGI